MIDTCRRIAFVALAAFVLLNSPVYGQSVQSPPQLAAPPAYVKVECPRAALVIGLFGQSNSANYVQPPFSGTVPDTLYQYDWKTDACYRYREPLLGADNTHGSTITPAAVALARSVKRPVVIAPFGVGGTSVLAWAYGFLAQQQTLALARLKQHGLAPQAFLWHQGEADGGDGKRTAEDLARLPHFAPPQERDFNFGLSESAYRLALTTVVRRTLKVFPQAAFGIALVSNCGGEPVRKQLRAAQRSVVRSVPRAFVSADSDHISGPQNRYDGCHFSQAGAERLSEQYLASLRKALRLR
ncbi:MAG: sialate O-acetylesterase [Hyphomicrobiales bacterium]